MVPADSSPTYRVAALSLNQTPLDFGGNIRRIADGLAEAKAAGAELVCCPELAISGYGAEDAFLWPSVAERSLSALGMLLPHSRGLVVAVGLPLFFNGLLHNVVALLVDGDLRGFACKRHLAGDGIHYEPRWFHAWSAGLATEIQVSLGDAGSRLVPVGDWVFEVGGLRIGFEICEDAWVSERPGAELAQSGVDVILNPSASHFAFGKDRTRRALVEAGSRDFGCAYVYANLLGNEAGRSIYDGDGLIAEGGHITAASERFSFRELGLLYQDLSYRPHGCPRESARPGRASEFSWKLARTTPAESRPEAGLLTKEQEFARAVALGLFDYARKSKCRGYVVSLSGGADSAACALLVRLMVRLAVGARGLEAAAEALGVRSATSETALAHAVLTTAYQATAHSGSVTRTAARCLAEELSAEHHEFDVEPLVSAYLELGEQAFGRKITFPNDDIALQNLQARARAPGVWLLANVKGALLISTSNRSEAAVGYATMDGDTAGGLAPIAGIDKHYLRHWLVFMEKEGLAEMGPCRALRAVNEQAPTAELRPPEYGQTDETDLMPYDVLNAIERAFVSERLGPREVLAVLKPQFPAQDPAALRTWTRRFFELFARSQWKRERYAPSFHLDDRSLDPKTWCRFPILSGGFAAELEELSTLD